MNQIGQHSLDTVVNWWTQQATIDRSKAVPKWRLFCINIQNSWDKLKAQTKLLLDKLRIQLHVVTEIQHSLTSAAQALAADKAAADENQLTNESNDAGANENAARLALSLMRDVSGSARLTIWHRNQALRNPGKINIAAQFGAIPGNTFIHYLLTIVHQTSLSVFPNLPE